MIRRVLIIRDEQGYYAAVHVELPDEFVADLSIDQIESHLRDLCLEAGAVSILAGLYDPNYKRYEA